MVSTDDQVEQAGRPVLDGVPGEAEMSEPGSRNASAEHD